MKSAVCIWNSGWASAVMMFTALNELDYARHATVTEWLRDHKFDPARFCSMKSRVPSSAKSYR